MLQYQTILVFCVIAASAKDYENALRKLWSDNRDSVTGTTLVIQPSYQNAYSGRDSKAYKSYSFKPRAIPLRRYVEEPQLERNVYYTNEKNKSEMLFPGNYVPIAQEKSEVDSQLHADFHPKAIPLIRSDELQKRSLDVDEPIIEKPEGFSEVASRRSLSDILGEDDDDDDLDEDGDYEVEDLGDGELERKRNKIKKIKPKKLKKYMLPLLLAYKMKYFALVPVLVSGLVLLVGATGLAGFFFALFAAVMGLQKGGY